MISHRYEDYADRLGIHILDALTAVLFWPAVVVMALWAWRGMPTIYGANPHFLKEMKISVIFLCTMLTLPAMCTKKLKWYNIPFPLDDPRRPMMYPNAVYVIKFVMLGVTLTVWSLLAPDSLEPYRIHAVLVAIAVALLGVPPYIYRVVKLRKRTDLCQETDSDY